MKRLLMILLIALAILPGSALATWRQVDVFYLPLAQVKLSDQSLPYWAKEAEVVTMGGVTDGQGRAQAVSPTTSVTWTAAPANGLATESWMHFPPGVGEVEVVAEAEISSWAQAHGPGEGQAAAYGYAEATFAINGASTTALVDVESAVATSPVPGLPNLRIFLPIGPNGASLVLEQEVVFRNGSGKVPDAERDRRFKVDCPVTSFDTRESSRSSVYVWALGSPAGARGKSACEIHGVAKVTYHLLTHPRHCPQHP